MPRTSQPRLRRYGIASQTGLLAAIASLEQINLTNQLARKFAAQLSMACPPEAFRALGLERRQAPFTFDLFENPLGRDRLSIASATFDALPIGELGSAPCRERVCQYG